MLKETIFPLIGGLGLFFFGMQNMSEVEQILSDSGLLTNSIANYYEESYGVIMSDEKKDTFKGRLKSGNFYFTFGE